MKDTYFPNFEYEMYKNKDAVSKNINILVHSPLYTDDMKADLYSILSRVSLMNSDVEGANRYLDKAISLISPDPDFWLYLKLQLLKAKIFYGHMKKNTAGDRICEFIILNDSHHLKLEALVLRSRNIDTLEQKNLDDFYQLLEDQNDKIHPLIKSEILVILANKNYKGNAIKLYKKSLKILSNYKFNVLKAEAYIGLGEYKVGHNKHMFSEYWYLDALKVLAKSYSPLLHAKAYIGLGNASRGNLQFLFLNMALGILDKVKNRLLFIRANLGMANFFAACGQNYRAQEFLKIIFKLEPDNRFAKKIEARCKKYKHRSPDDFPNPCTLHEVKTITPFR